MFAVTIKGKTLAEMQENAIQIAGIFKDAISEKKLEKKLKTSTKTSGLKGDDLSAVAASESEYAPRRDEIEAQAATKNNLLDDVPAEKPAAKKAASKITKDDLIATMQKLVESKGIQAVRDILKNNSVNRLTDLLPEQYQTVADQFNAAI